MPDIDFAFFGRVPGNYAARVQWYSTLFPIMGRVVHKVAELQEETKALIQMWRARTAVLADYDWKVIAGARPLQSVRNCCPAFSYTLPRTRCCHLTICPFCHGRWVREVWQMLEEALHGETLGEPQWYSESDDLPKEVEDLPAVCRFKLVERVTRTKPIPYSVDIPAQLEEIFDLTKRARVATFKALPAAAGFSNTSIEPDKTGWKVRHRQLLLFQQDADVAHPLLKPDDRRQVTVHELPTRGVLSRAVARVCRYPTAMMRGDPSLVAALLTARRQHKPRLTATYGRFRGLLK